MLNMVEGETHPLTINRLTHFSKVISLQQIWRSRVELIAGEETGLQQFIWIICLSEKYQSGASKSSEDTRHEKWVWYLQWWLRDKQNFLSLERRNQLFHVSVSCDLLLEHWHLKSMLLPIPSHGVYSWYWIVWLIWADLNGLIWHVFSYIHLAPWTILLPWNRKL